MVAICDLLEQQKNRNCDVFMLLICWGHCHTWCTWHKYCCRCHWMSWRYLLTAGLYFGECDT